MQNCDINIKTLEYISKFQDKYLRVRKRSGKKNLRCFPCCTNIGHVQDGYCGQPVYAHMVLDLAASSSSGNGNDFNFSQELLNLKENAEILKMIYVYGEIDVLVKNPRFNIGDRYPLNDLGLNCGEDKTVSDFPNPTSLVRRKDNADLPLIKGHMIVTKSASKNNNSIGIKVIINRESDAWHYPWYARKHTTNDQHTFRIYAFIVDMEKNELKCIGNINSSPFTVLTTRPSLLAKKGVSVTPPGPTKIMQSGVSVKSEDNVRSSEGEGDQDEEEEEDIGSKAIAEGAGKVKKRQVISNKEDSEKAEQTTKRKRRKVVTEDVRNQAVQPLDTSNSSTIKKINRFYKSIGALTFGNNVVNQVVPRPGVNNLEHQKVSEKPKSIEGFSSMLLGELITGIQADFLRLLLHLKQVGNIPNYITQITMEENFWVLVARDLADYLTADNSFTNEVSALFRNCRKVMCTEYFSVKDFFEAFNKIVLNHIEVFLLTRNLNFAALEKGLSFIPIAPINENEADSNSDSKNDFQMKQINSSSLNKTPEMEINDPRFDFDGSWLYIGEEDSENEIVKRLDSLGVPGFLLKLARRAQFRSDIYISKDWLVIQSGERFANHVKLVYALDGQVHQQVFPTFLPIAFPNRIIEYQAYIDYVHGCIIVDNFFIIPRFPDKQLHFCRKLTLSEDNIEMMVETTWSIVTPVTGHVEIIGILKNPFLRVWKNSGDQQTSNSFLATEKNSNQNDTTNSSSSEFIDEAMSLFSMSKQRGPIS